MPAKRLDPEIFTALEAHNQMATAWIKHQFGNRVEAESAGLKPGVINPMAVRTLHGKGIDISGAKTCNAFEPVRSGHAFSQVVTVCDESSAEKYPPFPDTEHVQHWDLSGPTAQTGDKEFKMNRLQQIWDKLRRRTEEGMAELKVKK